MAKQMDIEKKYRCKDRLKVRHLSKHHIITTSFSVCVYVNLEILVPHKYVHSRQKYPKKKIS